MYSFLEEDMKVIFGDGADLLEAHYREVAKYQDIALKPDFETYFKVEGMGNMKVYTIRTEDKKELVGYALFFLKKNMHYSDSLQAVQDILYVEKSHRGSGLGSSFIKWCDDQLAAFGVQVVYHHVKSKKELNFGPMLEKHGYELIDHIYGRRLDKWE